VSALLRANWQLLLVAVTGLLSVSSIALGTLLAFMRYRGPFSLLNLTISELGLATVSPWAGVFNGSLIAGGVCLAAFTLGLGALLRGWWGALLLLVGGITGIAVALVGVFPVDHPLHQVVGPAAFLAGLLSCGLFSVALLVGQHPRLPRRPALPGLLAGSAIGLYMSMPLLLPDGMNQIFAAPNAAVRRSGWLQSPSGRRCGPCCSGSGALRGMRGMSYYGAPLRLEIPAKGDEGSRR